MRPRPDAMRPRLRPRPERVRPRLRPRPNDLASRPHGQPENNAAIWIYCVGQMHTSNTGIFSADRNSCTI